MIYLSNFIPKLWPSTNKDDDEPVEAATEYSDKPKPRVFEWMRKMLKRAWFQVCENSDST